MQSCRKCQVTIRGKKACCPLCGGTLSGEPESDVFPDIPRSGVSRMSFMRVSLFLFIAFQAAMIVLGLSLSEFPSWIPFAMAAAGIGIVDTALTVYYRNNLLQLVVLEIYIGLGVAILADLFTGSPYWSVIWVAPIGFAGLTVTIAAIGKASHMRAGEYIMYLLFDVIVSTGVQGILILLDVNKFRVPALISMAFVIVFFVGMIIFHRRVFGRESRKLFNI